MASSCHNPDPGTPLRTTAAVEHKHFQVHNPDALLKGHGSEDTRNEIPSKSLTSIIMVIAFGGAISVSSALCNYRVCMKPKRFTVFRVHL